MRAFAGLLKKLLFSIFSILIVLSDGRYADRLTMASGADSIKPVDTKQGILLLCVIYVLGVSIDLLSYSIIYNH